jgi:hypothetical protein
MKGYNDQWDEILSEVIEPTLLFLSVSIGTIMAIAKVAMIIGG